MIKEKLLKLKQWISIHPKTAAMYTICLGMLLLVALVGAEMINIGSIIGNGESANPLTFDQNTGLLFVLSGMVMLLLGWMLFNFWMDAISDLPSKEEKKYKQKHGER